MGGIGQGGDVAADQVVGFGVPGRAVAVRVFPGNTGDPAAFTEIADVVRDKFGLAQMVMVGEPV